MQTCYETKYVDIILFCLSIIVIALGCVAIGIMIYCFVKFIKYYCKKQTSKTNLLSIIGLIYFIISIFCIIFSIARNVGYTCSKQIIMLNRYFTYIQIFFMWIIYFIRVHLIFKDSFEHSLSNITI
eukprot:437011_1